jgi:glyoxylase-like metal-dependent hydrolase (beta-lactamase superfamily II)
MEIAPGIHVIPTEFDMKLGTFAPRIYLVAAGEGAFVDSGYGSEDIANCLLEYANSLQGLKPSYIIVTHAHPDHISGAMRLVSKSGAKLVLHSAEQTDIPVDKSVEDGDIISLDGIDLEIVHTPGHNPGHICIYVRDERIMFTGDHVLADRTTALQPPWGDMAQYINSLKKLLSYDIDLMLPAHGPFITQPKKRLEELIRHRLEREEQVITLVRQGKGTVEELVAEIYPALTGFLYLVAKGQISAHLVKLNKEGKASSVGEGESARYTMN